MVNKMIAKPDIRYFFLEYIIKTLQYENQIRKVDSKKKGTLKVPFSLKNLSF